MESVQFGAFKDPGARSPCKSMQRRIWAGPCKSMHGASVQIREKQVVLGGGRISVTSDTADYGGGLYITEVYYIILYCSIVYINIC